MTDFYDFWFRLDKWNSDQAAFIFNGADPNIFGERVKFSINVEENYKVHSAEWQRKIFQDYYIIENADWGKYIDEPADTSATAFGIVKTLGACYLIYLGVRTLLARHSTSDITTLNPDSPYRLFSDGVLVSVLNPKIAIFLLAFLPQFLMPERGSIQHQFLLLGLLYVVLALCTDGAYALFASSIRRFLSRQLMLGALPKYTSGFVYLGLGLSLALAYRRT